MPEILEVDTEPTKPAQTSAPATEPTAWMSPDGEFRDGAPENIQALLAAKKWTNVNQLVTAYSELEKFKGIGEHLVIPEAEDAEGWDNVYNMLGRPETYDKYEFEDDEDVPINAEIIDKWKQFAHKEHYTQRQASAAVEFQRDIIKEVMKTEQQQRAQEDEEKALYKEEVIKALKQKWGGELAYQNKIRESRIIADNLGIYQTLESKGLASDPDIINMLDIIKTRTSEDVITPSTPTTPTKSPQEELEEIKKSEAFLKKFDPKHKETMKRFMALNQMIANAGQAQQPRI